MRLSIKAKQVIAVTSIVVLAVIAMSVLHLESLARVNLEESQARGELLANAIFHRAREVVATAADPYAALKEDPGLRSIVESSLYSRNVTYAAIVDVNGVAMVHSDPRSEGTPLPPGGDLLALLEEREFTQLRTIYSDQGRTLELRKPLLMGDADFGSIRIGVSTLLIRAGLASALKPALVAAGLALVISSLFATVLAQLLLRPINLIRSGLTRLGQGEFGIKLDLPQDEFGELGTFFNTVSQQLSAERNELVGQKASLESVVEHLEDAVAVFNPKGELLFANPAMRELLPPDFAAADSVLPAEHPYRQLLDETLATRGARGPVSVRVAAAASPDGEPAPERMVTTHAIEGRDQRLIGVMLIARNLEYLGQVQSTFKYSRKLAALGRLTAGVAHEVKNPLNAMMIHLELLRLKLAGAYPRPVASEVRADAAVASPRSKAAVAAVATDDAGGIDVSGALDHVKVIQGEIRRLDNVVQGFLKFTRPEDLDLQPVDLPMLLREIGPIVAPEAQQHGIVVQYDCARGVPAINGDLNMLRQAFINLAQNACQAMPNGGTLRIACASAKGGRVEVRFEDTGVGIKQEHLEKIFQLYFTTKEKGSGIGLAMVYRTVQLHDGEIEVESTPGRGTTFRLLLPQA